MRCETSSTKWNTSLKLLENLLFSSVLNQNTPGSENIVNRYESIWIIPVKVKQNEPCLSEERESLDDSGLDGILKRDSLSR